MLNWFIIYCIHSYSIIKWVEWSFLVIMRWYSHIYCSVCIMFRIQCTYRTYHCECSELFMSVGMCFREFTILISSLYLSISVVNVGPALNRFDVQSRIYRKLSNKPQTFSEMYYQHLSNIWNIYLTLFPPWLDFFFCKGPEKTPVHVSSEGLMKIF